MKPAERNPEIRPNTSLPLFESGLSTPSFPSAQCETGTEPRRSANSSVAPGKAHARRSDPQTSHAAAASVVNLGRTKEMILAILRDSGPCTDEGIIEAFHRRTYPAITASDSGIRTRRSWLVANGFVEACGTGETAAKRPCTIWRLTLHYLAAGIPANRRDKVNDQETLQELRKMVQYARQDERYWRDRLDEAQAAYNQRLETWERAKERYLAHLEMMAATVSA